jgi:hypothetical protein
MTRFISENLLYVYVCTSMYVCMYVCMYIYIYMDTDSVVVVATSHGLGGSGIDSRWRALEHT